VDPCLYIVELGLECTQLVVGLLGLESPLLAALGEVRHLVLELLEGGLEGLMLALPKVPALAEEPNQRARSAPAVLGCPLWSPSRRLAGKGSVHACLLLPHPWEHPKLAPAQQKKQNLARSNWQSRSTFHGARATLCLMTAWKILASRPACWVAAPATTISWASITLPITPPLEFAAAISMGESPSRSAVTFWEPVRESLSRSVHE